MDNRFSHTRLIVGDEGIKDIARARVLIFGLGGVGGYTAEALGRAGIGSLDLVDHDTIDITNINRQITALSSTVGEYKTDVMARRILDINPACNVRTFHEIYLPENKELFDFAEYDYVVDAVDTITGKLLIIQRAQEANTPCISIMGTGNKVDPTQLEVSDISKTSICPLAKIIRKELRKRGVNHAKVVYSREPAKDPIDDHAQEKYERDPKRYRPTPGTMSFVPSAAGLIAAGVVINDISHTSPENEG